MRHGVLNTATSRHSFPNFRDSCHLTHVIEQARFPDDENLAYIGGLQPARVRLWVVGGLLYFISIFRQRACIL